MQRIELQEKGRKLAEVHVGSVGPAAEVDDRFRAALQYHRAGKLEQAKDLYRQVIDAEPVHANTFHMLGVVFCQEGQPELGGDFIKRAIGVNPHVAEYHNNLGIALKEMGDIDGAIECFRKAIEVKPGFGQGHYNLGHVLDDTGDVGAAITSYKAAIDVSPNLSEAHNNLGNLLNEIGKPEEAITYCRRAIDFRPDFPEAYNNLGNVLNDLGKLEEATACYQRALALKPDSADCWNNLGSILSRQGRLKESVTCYLRACLASPGNPIHWQRLANALMRFDFSQVVGLLEEHLEACLEVVGIDKQGLGRPILSLLAEKPSIQSLLGLAQDGRADAIAERVQNISAFKPLNHPILLRFMEAAIITDPVWERLFTEIRRALLQYAVRDQLSVKACEEVSPFLSALAQQCFLNEYVYYVTPEEMAWLEELKARIKNSPGEDDTIRKVWLALLAAYLPLLSVGPTEEFRNLADMPDESLKRIITTQVEEPVEEKNIRTGIRKLTKVEDAVSKAVQMQYEESPYPRWVNPQCLKPLPMGKRLQRLFPHLANVVLMNRKPLSVLVAGCGTGKHPIQCATSMAGSRILALDLSRFSLAYGIRKAKEMGIKNIEFAQADILELATLEQRFDVIECCGVLHHLRDPLEGWRILTGLLRRGGYMAVGLYSAIGRRAMTAARTYIEEQGYKSSKDGIRQCRRDILSMPDMMNIKRVAYTKDFFTTSSCRDLLFHVQEHCLTLPEIDRMLDELGLEFLGFEIQDPRVINRYKVQFPEDPSATSLQLWNRYETNHPETFASMYQFWVKKV